MMLRKGIYYRAANGEKVGPMRWGIDDCWQEGDSIERYWLDNGLRYFVDDRGTGSDLVAEWTDEPTGPVRTVTRKEIVPGVYGRLSIQRQASPESEPRILVNLAGETGQVLNVHHGWSRAELRAAIATLTEIADALDEQANGRGRRLDAALSAVSAEMDQIGAGK